eukprot:m.77943 g.77943  ORF g.77943 m.77943 type:complete len:245 (-) comp14090_c0_seq3:266-1000(-)
MACRWVPLEHRQDLPPVLDLDTAIIQAYFGVLQDVASKFGDIPAEYSADFDAFCKVITRETSAEELQASKEAFAKVLDALAVTNSILDLSPAAKSCPRLSGAILVVPGIYIGSLATAKDKKLLTETGITHIVSCLQDTPFPDDFKYMHFAARDTEEQDISQFFDSTYQFINDALAAKGKVLGKTTKSRKWDCGHKPFSLPDRTQQTNQRKTFRFIEPCQVLPFISKKKKYHSFLSPICFSLLSC